MGPPVIGLEYDSIALGQKVGDRRHDLDAKFPEGLDGPRHTAHARFDVAAALRKGRHNSGAGSGVIASGRFKSCLKATTWLVSSPMIPH
jgi:hypothetical protein